MSQRFKLLAVKEFQAEIASYKHLIGKHSQSSHGRRIHLAGKVKDLLGKHPDMSHAQARRMAALHILKDTNAPKIEKNAARRVIGKDERKTLGITPDKPKWGAKKPKPKTPKPKVEAKPKVSPITKAFGNDPNKQYEFKNKIVDLDSLITSNTDGGAINPAYSKELQPRDRSREASKKQISSMAKNFVPESALWDFHQIDKGPPIIGDDSMVESGNGRTLTMRKMRNEHPEKWAEYQKKLRENLEGAGLSEADLKGVKNPVLVRERLSKVDRVAFAKEANNPTVLQMSPYETAAQDAHLLSDASLGDLEIGEDQTIEQALRSPKNRAFVSNFTNQLSDNERARIQMKDGAVNKQGLDRIKLAIFAKAFPDESGQRLAETFTEAVDSNTKNFENAISATLPKISKADSLIRKGVRPKELSITEDLSNVVETLARHRDSGDKRTMQQVLSQPTFGDAGAEGFGRSLTPFQESLLLYFDEIGRSPTKVKKFINDWYSEILNPENNPLQAGDMFGMSPDPLTKETLLKRLTGRDAAKMQAQMGFALAELGKGKPSGNSWADKLGLPPLKPQKKDAEFWKNVDPNSLVAALNWDKVAPQGGWNRPENGIPTTFSKKEALAFIVGVNRAAYGLIDRPKLSDYSQLHLRLATTTYKHGTHDQSTHGRRHLAGRIKDALRAAGHDLKKVSKADYQAEKKKVAHDILSRPKDHTKQEVNAARRVVPKAERPVLPKPEKAVKVEKPKIDKVEPKPAKAKTELDAAIAERNALQAKRKKAILKDANAYSKTPAYEKDKARLAELDTKIDSLKPKPDHNEGLHPYHKEEMKVGDHTDAFGLGESQRDDALVAKNIQRVIDSPYGEKNTKPSEVAKAFEDTVNAYLKANPNATEEEKAKLAGRVGRLKKVASGMEESSVKPKEPEVPNKTKGDIADDNFPFPPNTLIATKDDKITAIERNGYQAKLWEGGSKRRAYLEKKDSDGRWKPVSSRDNYIDLNNPKDKDYADTLEKMGMSHETIRGRLGNEVTSAFKKRQEDKKINEALVAKHLDKYSPDGMNGLFRKFSLDDPGYDETDIQDLLLTNAPTSSDWEKRKQGAKDIASKLNQSTEDYIKATDEQQALTGRGGLTDARKADLRDRTDKITNAANALDKVGDPESNDLDALVGRFNSLSQEKQMSALRTLSEKYNRALNKSDMEHAKQYRDIINKLKPQGNDLPPPELNNDTYTLRGERHKFELPKNPAEREALYWVATKHPNKSYNKDAQALLDYEEKRKIFGFNGEGNNLVLPDEDFNKKPEDYNVDETGRLITPKPKVRSNSASTEHPLPKDKGLEVVKSPSGKITSINNGEYRVNFWESPDGSKKRAYLEEASNNGNGRNSYRSWRPLKSANAGQNFIDLNNPGDKDFAGTLSRLGINHDQLRANLGKEALRENAPDIAPDIPDKEGRKSPEFRKEIDKAVADINQFIPSAYYDGSQGEKEMLMSRAGREKIEAFVKQPIESMQDIELLESLSRRNGIYSKAAQDAIDKFKAGNNLTKEGDIFELDGKKYKYSPSASRFGGNEFHLDTGKQETHKSTPITYNGKTYDLGAMSNDELANLYVPLVQRHGDLEDKFQNDVDYQNNEGRVSRQDFDKMTKFVEGVEEEVAKRRSGSRPEKNISDKRSIPTQEEKDKAADDAREAQKKRAEDAYKAKLVASAEGAVGSAKSELARYSSDIGLNKPDVPDSDIEQKLMKTTDSFRGPWSMRMEQVSRYGRAFKRSTEDYIKAHQSKADLTGKPNELTDKEISDLRERADRVSRLADKVSQTQEPVKEVEQKPEPVSIPKVTNKTYTLRGERHPMAPPKTSADRKRLEWVANNHPKESLRDDARAMLGVVANNNPANPTQKEYRGDTVRSSAKAEVRLTVFKEAKTGKYRWVAFSSTTFKDRDGQYISTPALSQAVARMDARGNHGPLRWWHVPGLDLGTCDFSMLAGKMLVESGTFTSNAFAEKLKEKTQNGEYPMEVSVGYTHPISEPDTDGVFHNIDIFERSVMPRGKASNPYTSFAMA